MASETPNHSLNKYTDGEYGWEHSTDMDTIEKRLAIADTDTNKSNYTPHAGATYIATDTDVLYQGDGSNWVKATRDVNTLKADAFELGSDGPANSFSDIVGSFGFDGLSDVSTGTLANRPIAGTSGDWYFTTDNNGVYRDNGSSWDLIAEYPGNISPTDLGFDPATQTELDNHAGTTDAHHAKYTDSDAITAINNDIDHGSTASHNYFSGSHADLSNITSDDHHTKTSSASELTDVSADSVSSAHHSKYTDSEAQSAVSTYDDNVVASHISRWDC